MKKIFKRFFLVIIILILVIGGPFIWYMLKAKSEIKIMAPIETQQIVENVFSVRDTFVNMYLVKDGDQYVAIDAGNNADNVAYELKKLKINPDQVIALFLTHTDGDHVAAVKIFKKAQVYLSKAEGQLLNGQKSRFLIFGNKIATKEYLLIDDQQQFTFGNIKVKGILTPGHTIGSMCYLVNDKYLFTGDALSLKNGKIDLFNLFFNMDSKSAAESMGLITNIPTAEYIFTAHYGFTNDYKKAVKDWRK